MRGFARRRPDVRVTLLRCANVIGPHVDQPAHVLLPAAGDPDRARASTPGCSSCTRTTCSTVLQHAVVNDVPGTFNVAGDGMLMLSQAIRRLQRPSIPLPRFAVGGVGSVLRSARLADFSPEQIAFLTYGRGVDTTRMRTELGFEPATRPPRRSPTSRASLPPTGGRTDRGRLGRRLEARARPAPADAGRG